jgi:DNA polymerase gamma 1
MVSKSVFKKLFPGVEYVGSDFDDQPEPRVLPLAPEGVVNSLNRMAGAKLAPYMEDLSKLLDLEIEPPTSVPDYESQPAGWSKLSNLESVPYPPGRVRVIDVETLVKQGSVPVMAVALCPDGFYIWKTPKLGDLIPIGNNRLTLGHNVSYDMARFKESYQGLEAELYCLDTMNMSTMVSGFCSAQVAVKLKLEGQNETNLPRWAYKGFGKSNYKSLGDTFKFYCRGSKMMAPDKSLRNKFVDAESLENLVDDWQQLLLYNVLDTVYTLKVFQKVYPLWRSKTPTNTSLYGQMCSGFYRLPLNTQFQDWVANTDKLYHQTVDSISSELEQVALERVSEYTEMALDTLKHYICTVSTLYAPYYKGLATKLYLVTLAYLRLGGTDDPWLTKLDWNVKLNTRKLKGYPEWYRKAKSGQNPHITLKSQLAPYLLKLAFEGEPVIHSKPKGWHTRVSKIPHPTGEGNVGYLFSKDFLPMYDNGMLKANDDRCQALLTKAVGISYWTSVRSRVMNTTVVNNWTLPELGGGAVSNRVNDPLWLTTCEAKKHLLGSELKSRIKAPDGHKLLIADFSSQEMRIAWTLGDARVGKVGGTPMSLSGIKGSKSEGTDAHSMTATKISNITGKKFPRQGAKVINFSMLYMAGVKTVSGYIRQVLPEVTIAEARTIAKETLEYRRGKVTYNDNSREYTGGTDSETYTAIDIMACSPKPRTVLLDREMPDPLCPLYCRNEFYTTRANWTIQAPARDQLDCLTTAFNYMAEYAGLKAKLIWSRHDEVIVLAPDSEVTQVSELLQQAHIFTWAALHEKLGLYDLPSHGLLFEEINVDTVCRKEVDSPLETPSISDPEPVGYYIKASETKGYSFWDDIKH